MNDAGRIGFVIRGDYSGLETYDFLDVVYYNGSSYVAKRITTGNAPAENNDYWQVLASGMDGGAVTGVKGSAESAYRQGNVNITAENIGLGNVGNFKAVSTVASQGLTDTEKSNARANIGAGTSSFSGSYNDLANKPAIPSVGNGTITIKQAGTSKGTFTTNQSGDTTIELTDNNTTYSNMTAATASAAGKAGLVPAPAAGAQAKYLRGDGTWQTPPDTNTTYPNASASAAGLVSTGAQTFAGAKTFNGAVSCAGASAVGTAQARNIYAGTSDMTPGTTELATGTIYVMYE